jgi:hypothetical protein
MGWRESWHLTRRGSWIDQWGLGGVPGGIGVSIDGWEVGWSSAGWVVVTWRLGGSWRWIWSWSFGWSWRRVESWDFSGPKGWTIDSLKRFDAFKGKTS